MGPDVFHLLWPYLACDIRLMWHICLIIVSYKITKSYPLSVNCLFKCMANKASLDIILPIICAAKIPDTQYVKCSQFFKNNLSLALARLRVPNFDHFTNSLVFIILWCSPNEKNCYISGGAWDFSMMFFYLTFFVIMTQYIFSFCTNFHDRSCYLWSMQYSKDPCLISDLGKQFWKCYFRRKITCTVFFLTKQPE